MFILIDINNYFSRFYYSNPENCVERYLRMIKDIISNFSPGYLCNLIDAPCSFRKKLYPEYKANREKKPEDYYIKLDNLLLNLKMFKYPYQKSKSLEAEDLMNLFVNNIKDMDFVLFSNDKDILQLESKNVLIFNYVGKKINDVFELFEQKSYSNLGFESKDEMILAHTLQGDATDNIPGVKGIGKKTAYKIAKKYKSYEVLNTILNNIFLKDSILEKIRSDIDIYHTSYKLVILFDEKYTFNLKKYEI